MNIIHIDKEYILGIGYDEVVESVITAFKGYISPGVIQPPRQELILDDPPRFFGSMPCYIKEYNVLSVKLITYFFDNPRLYGKKPFNSIVILFSGDDGEILAYLDGDIITTLRTAGMTVASTKYLSPRPPKKISLIGVGVQGRMMAEMHLSIFDSIEEVKIFNRTFSKAVEYSRYISKRFGVDSSPIDDIKTIGEDVDVVMAATSSPSPVIYGDYIEPSTHIISIGYVSRDSRELDESVYGIADKIFIDSLDALDSGDIRVPLEKGVIERDRVKLFSELILGYTVGREDENEITIFKSVGSAVQDGYLSYRIYRRYIKEVMES